MRDQLRSAFAALRAGRRRPAYLDIPLDLIAEPTVLRPESFPDGAEALAPAAGAIPPALTLLDGAQRPLIIAGGGARGAGAALRQLAESLDAYLVTTVAGKGVVAESHPANLGVSLPFAPTQERVAAADVVVAAGTEACSETDLYTTTRLAMDGHLVRIDVDARKLEDQYAAAVRVHADAAAGLALLARGVRTRRGWRSAAGDGAAHRARIEAQFERGTRAMIGALRALRESLPADGVVFSDMTQIAYLGNYAFAAERPGVWFHPCGYGTLRLLPSSRRDRREDRPARASGRGARRGFRRAVHLAGADDSGRRLDLTLPLVIWNNGALGPDS